MKNKIHQIKDGIRVKLISKFQHLDSSNNKFQRNKIQKLSKLKQTQI